MIVRCSLSQHNFTIPLLFHFALEPSVWQTNGELKHLKLNLLNLYLFYYFIGLEQKIHTWLLRSILEFIVLLYLSVWNGAKLRKCQNDEAKLFVTMVFFHVRWGIILTWSRTSFIFKLCPYTLRNHLYISSDTYVMGSWYSL